eukprot:GFUD01004644.1.p1 GENE.GFUD01004644.1~~GFUD01004644.1.p1  ORF type:complete len:509 (-),score=206.05 GFUD01004644.1:166-1530(-)
MEIDQSATTADVRKAYKKMALVLHPDKNDSPDAEVQFRQLAAIYEVLKDKTTREMYDKVLVEGLPNWKNPAFYFRRMRKIGLAEGLLYLIVIVTGIQYCVNWAAYYERKFTISENVGAEVRRKAKRLRKEGKNEDEVAQEIIEAEMNMLGPKPTCFDTVPFQLMRLCKYLVFLIPTIPGMVKEHWNEQKRLKEEKQLEQEEYEEEKKRREEEKQKKKDMKAKRKNVHQFKEAVESEECLLVSPEAPEEKVLPRNANQMWTDDDLIELARLIKKIPGGSTDRWERIADIMERYPEEVTKMAGKIKNNPNIVPKVQGVTGREEERLISDQCLEVGMGNNCEQQNSTETEESEEEVDEDGYLVLKPSKTEEYVIPEEKKKKKTKGGKLGDAEQSEEEQWSQEQQQGLEKALSQFPKGTSERWDRIAGKVEGKTKEQCVLRFKFLAEQVKKKKAGAEI